MRQKRAPDPKAYEQVVGTFKKHKSGITLADVAAGTGLSLEKVRTLVPLAADEYSARLEVTESGEILYSFPRGFRSRYRGPGPALKKILSSFTRFTARAGMLLFKAWIMVMLFGYFIIFMVIALASLFISFSASKSNNRHGGQGGWNFSVGVFDLIIRLWFYSELLGGQRRRYAGPAWGGTNRKIPGKGRPLYRAIFSFVFGEDDPNRLHQILEKKAFISYVRKQRGVVSLPELMTLTGQSPEKAESLITKLCAEFHGSPEATEDGTVVYRFDEILSSGEEKDQENTAAMAGLSPGLFAGKPGTLSTLCKKLRVFSSNPKKLNFAFGLINGVNLLFGSYFLYNTIEIGRVLSETMLYNEAALRNAGLYGRANYFISMLGFEAFPVIQIGLGLIPLLFSALFWLIPAIRSLLLKKENDSLRLDNFRGLFCGSIWACPEGFRPAGLEPREQECRPRDLEAARELVLKEMGSYSSPEVSLDEGGKEVFDFHELRREKDALEKYRLSVDPARALPGKTVFDSYH